jgi:uncharacterized protein YkwD
MDTAAAAALVEVIVSGTDLRAVTDRVVGCFPGYDSGEMVLTVETARMADTDHTAGTISTPSQSLSRRQRLSRHRPLPSQVNEDRAMKPLLVFLLLTSSIAAQQQSVVVPTEEELPEPAITSHEAELVESINHYRACRGLWPLRVDPLLQRLARMRVSVFNHRHPKYGWMHEHARREGFRGPCTDNLAQGYATPREAVGDGRSGWGDETSKSVGHDRQMKGQMKLNGVWRDQRFNRCGVAVHRRNYIAVFGRVD